MNGTVELDCRPGPSTVLTSEEEDRLQEYLVKMADMGFGLIREIVMRVAYFIAEKSNSQTATVPKRIILFATEVGGNPLCRVRSMASSMLLSTPSYLPALMYRRQFFLFLERHMLYLPTYQVPFQMKIAWTVEGELTAVLTTFAQEEVCVPEWDIKKR